MASSRTTTIVREALIVIGAFVLVGVFCGWLWHHLWAPGPTGIVFDHVPRFEDDAEFRGTGLYFLIATIAGLAVSLVLTFVLEHDEVWILAAVVVGSLLAGGVMAAFGHVLGPDSAADFAAGAEDFEKVHGDLHAAMLTILVSFPGGALLGSVIVLTCFTHRQPRVPREEAPTAESAVGLTGPNRVEQEPNG